MPDKHQIDPEEQRYRRNYPKFPGVAETVRILRSGKARGTYLEALLSDLREHASEVLHEVTGAVAAETDGRVRRLLVGELAATGDDRLLGFFTDLLTDADEDVAGWAEVGLRTIDTKASRTALFDHRRPR